MTPGSKKESAWSPRSQKSLLEEDRLRRELAAVNSIIGMHQRNISTLEQDRERMKRHRDSVPPALSGCLQQLRAEQDHLAFREEQRAEIQKQMDALALTPAQSKKRAEHQDKILLLIRERLEKTAQVDKALEVLTRLLRDRAEQTENIRQHCVAIELSTRLLDTKRFDDLLAALPQNIGAESENWSAWFLGEPQEAADFVVRDEQLVIAETLASSGVHHFGDVVTLELDTAKELLREDRRSEADFGKHPRSLPASILTLEGHEVAVSKGECNDLSAQEVCRYEDHKIVSTAHDDQLETAYSRNGIMRPKAAEV